MADNNQTSTPDILVATPEVIMGITITITDIIREAEVGPAVWMAIATSGREWLWFSLFVLRIGGFAKSRLDHSLGILGTLGRHG